MPRNGTLKLKLKTTKHFQFELFLIRFADHRKCIIAMHQINFVYISNRLKKMAGVFGPEQPANADIQALINNENVQNAVVAQAGPIEMYIAIVFIVQSLIGGTTWVVKVQIGEGENDYLHLMINQIVDIDAQPQLGGLQPGHTANDPLVPF